jgi:hypothetical protein
MSPHPTGKNETLAVMKVGSLKLKPAVAVVAVMLSL